MPRSYKRIGRSTGKAAGTTGHRGARTSGRGNSARAAQLSSRTPASGGWGGFASAMSGWAAAFASATQSTAARGPTSADAADRAAPSTAREPTPAEQAAALLGPLRATTQEAVGSSGEAREASVAATEQLAALVEGQPPEVQAEILAGARSEIAQLTRQMEHLSQEETDRAAAALARVAESVGSDHVRLLTDTMATELPSVMTTGPRGRWGGQHRVLDALGDAIEGGQGALLATAMARSLADDGHGELAEEVHTRAGEAVAAVRERYDEAKAAVDSRNAELAVQQTTWGATLDEDARAAGVEAFLAHHEDDYTELDEMQAVLASTLEGASFGVTAPSGFDADDATSAFGSALAAIPDLARSEAGSAVLVDAMARSAAGRGSFLDVQRDRLDQQATIANALNASLPSWMQADGAHAGAATLDTALLEATAIQTDAAARQGDLGAMDRMLGDFSRFTDDRDLARTAEEIQEGIAAEWAEFEEAGGIIGGLDAIGSLESLQGRIGKVFTESAEHYLADRPDLQGRFEGIGLSFTVGSTLAGYAALAQDPDLESLLDAGGGTAGTLDDIQRHRDATIEGPTRLGRISAGAGLAGSALTSIQDPASVRAHLETVVDAAGYANAAGLLSSRALLGQVAKKAGVVGGVVFSAWDTWDALQRGDTYGAAASAAPLAGLGIGAAVGGPAGAAVGLVIGGVVGLGMELWRAWRRKDPIVQFEQRTQPFLEGAFLSMGLSESEADRVSHRFRDVNDDLVGVGPVLAGLAGEMGVRPEEMIRWAADLSDWEVHMLAKSLLEVDHEGDRLWEETGRPPGQGRDPRDPLDIALDRHQLYELGAWVRETHPDGPWPDSCVAP